MTLPRRVVPGATYLLTRRCLDRRFYLQPTPAMNQLFIYAFAAAQQKHDVAVHAFVAMGNHLHAVLTDTHGRLPDFMRDFHRELALGAKLLYRIPEEVWSGSKASAVELCSADAVFEKILYTILNPVETGLVAHAAQWPGAISLPGRTHFRARRPSAWFDSSRDDELTLEITPPRGSTVSTESWHRDLAEKLADGEAEILAKRLGEGRRRFLGVKKILQQRPFDRPMNRDKPKPTRNPALAAGGDAALLQAAIRRLREWRRAYREARERWRLDKTATFPLGTWWVVERAGAALA